MSTGQPSHDELLSKAERGDANARQQLLECHRDRLRRMVAVYLDRRLAARVDPSDVVQEALIEAARGLSDYFRERPLAFYPWLRQFAWQRLLQLHRQHIHAQRRSVDREEFSQMLPRSDRSAGPLADQLIARGKSPSHHVVQDELRRRVQEAMDQLSARDREILTMRHLEEMSASEIGAVLGISEGAVRVAQLRALKKLRNLLGDEPEENRR